MPISPTYLHRRGHLFIFLRVESGGTGSYWGLGGELRRSFRTREGVIGSQGFTLAWYAVPRWDTQNETSIDGCMQ